MNKVALIFRKKNDRFFSIEKVFEPLLSSFSTKYSITTLFSPCYSIGVIELVRNLIYFGRFRSSFNIFHITGDVHYVVIGLPKRRTLLTIHDLVFMNQHVGFKRLFFKWLYIDLPVLNSAVITTISEKSKLEILKYTNCKPEKIIVIPNAVGDNFYYSDLDFNSLRPRILFIGTTSNKNLNRVAEAIAGINCSLMIIGKPSFEQTAILNNFKISYSYKSGLSDGEMAFEYADSHIILFPSLYEGFGMPIIEGQRSGRPVITSNISPLIEVAGNGACFVDPNDSQSIRSGVKKVIESADYRKELIDQGLLNVKKYTPGHIADMYSKVYDSLIKSNN